MKHSKGNRIKGAGVRKPNGKFGAKTGKSKAKKK